MRGELPAGGLARPHRLGRMGVAEFIILAAALMALNALAIDIMLPALGEMADALKVRTPNQQQWIVTAYVLGFGVAQIVFGPISDAIGRKRVIQASLIGYSVTGFACFLAQDFAFLIAARVVQGVFAAGCRVAIVSVVRDLFGGRPMARIMSLVMTVFMIVPVLAPAIGQAILVFADWSAIFLALTLAGLACAVWTGLRLPETLAPEHRRPLNVSASLAAYREVFNYRVTVGYLAASGVVFGALFAFIATSEQIFADVFGAGDRFFLWFGIIAAVMAAASLANSRFVERYGMRRLSHGALLAFTVLSLGLTGLLMMFGEHLWLFMPLFALIFGFFGLMGANFNALAMEPLGHIAGSGSAAYGFMSTTVAALFGGFIGAQFNGSVIPVMVGFSVLGLATLGIVLIVERGRLMASR